LSSNGRFAFCSRVESPHEYAESDLWRHLLSDDTSSNDDGWVELELALQDRGSTDSAKYVYRDADGNFLRNKYRFADGGKAWDGRRHIKNWVPYRLPELLATDDAHVYIVDGERDVEALRKYGLCATCAPNGMSSWKPEYAAYFTNKRHVTIVQDKDSKGPAQAVMVKGMLPPHVTVTIVEAAEGKDAHDHIEAGLSVEEFVLVPPRFEGVDLVTYEPEPVEWLHEPILLARTHTAIVAPSGSGNTMLAVILIHSVVRLGHVVVYLDQENGPDVIKERMVTLNYTDEEMQRVKYYPWPNASKAEFAALVAEVLSHRPTLIVFDPLINFLAAAELDEDKAKDTTTFHTEMIVPLKRERTAILQFDHTGHNGAHARGSSAKVGHAEAEWLFSVDQNFDKGTTATATLKRGPKNRRTALPPRLEYTMGGDGKDGFIFRSRQVTLEREEVERWRDLLHLTEEYLKEHHTDEAHAIGADTLGVRLRDRGAVIGQADYRKRLKDWAAGATSRITAAHGRRGGYYYKEK
jgi:hypothetical protein